VPPRTGLSTQLRKRSVLSVRAETSFGALCARSPYFSRIRLSYTGSMLTGTTKITFSKKIALNPK
jgi:hypothetical protein